MFEETEKAWFEAVRERAQDYDGVTSTGLWCLECGGRAVEPDFICDKCNEQHKNERVE